jgi:hypothetical protein
LCDDDDDDDEEVWLFTAEFVADNIDGDALRLVWCNLLLGARQYDGVSLLPRLIIETPPRLAPRPPPPKHDDEVAVDTEHRHEASSLEMLLAAAA